MNLIEQAKLQAKTIIEQAYQTAVEKGTLPDGKVSAPVIEIPKDVANGDYASSFAMQCAKILHMAPKKIAEELIKQSQLTETYFSEITIAGPGFINFKLGNKWYADAVSLACKMGENYGRTTLEHPQKIMVEFVSANPTGPMHMGNARGGVLGDCLAEVLDWTGNDVSREFYINDAGNQVDKFAKSVEARYIQELKGEDAVEFQEDWYQGADIRGLAKQLIEIHGDKLLEMNIEDRHALIVDYGLTTNIAKMKADLARYKIKYDKWFSETDLHKSGCVKETVDILTAKGATYEKDGAIWLRSTDFGCEKDDVLMRANGFYTYFAADIAYHRNKLETRNYDLAINIWGADHHGHVKRLKSAMDALGLDGSHRIEVVLMQLVRLMRDGEIVRMSKRTGKSITLSDLLDEIPVDAARFFFNSRAAETHLEFDMGLAVREDSENPIYYVQYAHARICSVLRSISEEGIQVKPVEQVDLSLLTCAEEIGLIKAIAQLPEEIIQAAQHRDPSRLNKYAVSTAAVFHKFYNACRIKDVQEDLRDARLALCQAARQVIANSLKIIGVDAPERM